MTCCRVGVALLSSTGAVSRSPITSRSILGEPILSDSCYDLARFREFDPRLHEFRAASSADLVRARNLHARLLAANLDEAQPGRHLSDRVEEDENHVDGIDKIHGLRDLGQIWEETHNSIVHLEYARQQDEYASDEMHGLEILDAYDEQIAARRLALNESVPENPGLQESEDSILDERCDASYNKSGQEPIADVDQIGQDQTPHPTDHPLGTHSGVIGRGASARLEGELEELP